ncbi:Hypothetical predicted protein [Octopus vulgaris]|uniref:Secreted protein n=1 Tax=Octopus vulgaris TaxID=6645 RepID=A0AA36BIN2_OCTVU|nr:Hypothetical predicted protein [Octopus vulgaris]
MHCSIFLILLCTTIVAVVEVVVIVVGAIESTTATVTAAIVDVAESFVQRCPYQRTESPVVAHLIPTHTNSPYCIVE